MPDFWSHIANDMVSLFAGSPGAILAFVNVLLIDVVLAGDNALVVGALAAGLPADQRRRVILIGIIAALVLRVIFALMVSQLLQVVGLILAGGLLLLWVAWKLYRELQPALAPAGAGSISAEGGGNSPSKSFASAAWAVAAADVSMSLDNVLAVAGAARDHPGILLLGLILSVALMGIAANLIARYIERYRWIGYLGLVVIVFVAGKMIYEGVVDPTVGVMSLFA